VEHRHGGKGKDVLRAERAALCDTFEGLVRERDPRGMPGVLLGGPFERYKTKLRERQKAKGYDTMLERLRSGPPAFMMATMPAVNVNENWIHHEDARPANRTPRSPA
jgi:hypothetical protein